MYYYAFWFLETDFKTHLPVHSQRFDLVNLLYRIDHHLGEELVENLLVLRFSNLVFEPLWSRNYIRNVQLIFSEDVGTEERGRLVQYLPCTILVK